EGSEASLRKVADALDTNGGLVTPMTMMVLAIRFYDAGLRDDAVFWFYAAKDRYLASARVMDFSHPQLSEVAAAISAFAALAGPYINGYAFCDVARQGAIRAKEVEWVVAHPYEAALLPQIPGLPGDR